MSLSSVNEQFSFTPAGVDDLERELLALGPIPLRDTRQWSSETWARYEALVRDLIEGMAQTITTSEASSRDA